MNDIEVSSIDLVEGGNVFKQGHYLTLGYVPRDEKGETVDLSGKTLNVSLWGRKGVVFEATATYSAGVIRFTLDKMVPAGDYTVEFTVTSSTDAKYRKKFPTNQHSGRIAIKQSADDLGVVGIQVYTVAQLKAEQKALLDAAVSGFTVDSETKMARVSGTTTHPTIGARLEADKQATAAELAEKVGGANKATMDDLGQDVKEALTGGSVAVVGIGAVGTPNVQTKAITHDKTSFMIQTANRFNKDDLIVGKYYSHTSGTLVSDSTYSATKKIPINPSSVYKTNLTYFLGLVFWDQQGNYLSGIASDGWNGTINTPANAYYVSLSVRNITNLSGIMLVENELPESYVQYGFTFDGSVDIKDKIKGLSLTPENLEVGTISKNLFNKNAVQVGKYVYNDGRILSDSKSAVTGFIEVSGTHLFVSGLTPYADATYLNRYGAFYDSNYILVGTPTPLSKLATEKLFVIPAGAKYFNFSLYQLKQSAEVINLDSIQIELGQEKTPLVPFQSGIKTINGLPLKSFEENKNAATKKTEGAEILMFGDSITRTHSISADGKTLTPAQTNWPTYALPLLGIGKSKNYAMWGATFKDWTTTEPYQMIKNQINAALSSDANPNIVGVAMGTNDGVSNLGDYETAMGKATLADLDMTKTFEAMRWSFWTLRLNYPNATFYAALPLQRFARSHTAVLPLIEAIKKMANAYNFIVIDAYNESGIVRDFEVDGAEGRYLADGLHPNEAGKEKQGKLFARVIENTYMP